MNGEDGQRVIFCKNQSDKDGRIGTREEQERIGTREQLFFILSEANYFASLSYPRNSDYKKK